jgi:hypothetical protein
MCFINLKKKTTAVSTTIFNYKKNIFLHKMLPVLILKCHQARVNNIQRNDNSKYFVGSPFISSLLMTTLKGKNIIFIT